MAANSINPLRPFVPLLYHELRPEAAAYSYVLSCGRFAEQLELFAKVRRELPQSYVPLLTFDDGHISNYEHALPILEQHGVKAHFFITAGWTGVRSGYMAPEHLRALQTAGHTVGAHGWSHTLLTQCDEAGLRNELQDARTALEDHLGEGVTTMSLPGGRSNARVMDAARAAGYTTVWTSTPETTDSPDAPLIGRFNILASASDSFLEQLLDPESNVLQRAARASHVKATAQKMLGDRLYARLWALVNRQEAETPQGAAR